VRPIGTEPPSVPRRTGRFMQWRPGRDFGGATLSRSQHYMQESGRTARLLASPCLNSDARPGAETVLRRLRSYLEGSAAVPLPHHDQGKAREAEGIARPILSGYCMAYHPLVAGAAGGPAEGSPAGRGAVAPLALRRHFPAGGAGPGAARCRMTGPGGLASRAGFAYIWWRKLCCAAKCGKSP
jgi:hypothetical protein